MKKINRILTISVILFASCSNNSDEKNGTTKIAIGEKHEGGIIFYLDSSGTSGLIACPLDITLGGGGQNEFKQIMLTGNYTSGREEGYCFGSSLFATNSRDSTIGAGANNTRLIVEAEKGYLSAALICDKLIYGGYSDWFLPSKDEVNQMFAKCQILGMEENRGYWSSTEHDENLAWLAGNTKYPTAKKYRGRIRAIRAFGNIANMAVSENAKTNRTKSLNGVQHEQTGQTEVSNSQSPDDTKNNSLGGEITAKFIEASMGDSPHLIFNDESGKSWDFGSGKNHYGNYSFGEDVSNPDLVGKTFKITWKNTPIKTINLNGEETNEEIILPSIMKIEMINKK